MNYKTVNNVDLKKNLKEMLKPSYNVVFPLFAFLEGENLLNFWHPLKYNL